MRLSRVVNEPSEIVSTQQRSMHSRSWSGSGWLLCRCPSLYT